MTMNLNTIIKGTPLEEKDGVFFFHHPPADVVPSRDQNPSDKKAWSYWRTQNYLFFERELRALPKDSVLVDLGAGQSDFAELTAPFNLCAVDLYPYPGIHLVCDFGKGIPLKDASANIVMLSNVLEHVPEPNTLLQECHRILKPGGMLLATVPFMIQVHQRPYDFYRYTDINLRYLLTKHHFKDAAITPVSDLFVLLFNASASFFTRAIKETRYKLFWRVLWKLARIKLRVLRQLMKGHRVDPDNSLGYLVKAGK